MEWSQTVIEFPEKKYYYCIEEVVAMLPVSVFWIYRHTSLGNIPHHKFSGRLQFSEADIKGIEEFAAREANHPDAA